MIHDDDIGRPEELRMKVFAGNDLPTEDRLRYLIEFVAELDDRVKDLDQAFTNYVTRDVERPPR